MKRMLLAVAVALLLAATAKAQAASTTLNTSSVYVNSGNYIDCNIVNVSSSSVTVDADVLNSSNASIAVQSGVKIAPGAIVQIYAGNTYTGFARCRITVHAPAADVRANLTVFVYTGSFYQPIGFAEAR